MKKIIVKAEVRDVDKLENRLMNLGYDFDPMYWQHSRIFVPRNYEEHNNFARMILRGISKNRRLIWCMKLWFQITQKRRIFYCRWD